jgi:four helix bundle protein
MTYRNLHVLDAAEHAEDRVNELIERAPRPLLHARQLRDSAHSVTANISEGFGRGTGRDRDRSLAIARGESEETIQHLAANFRAERIGAKDYWPLRNQYVVIGKMINSIVNG